ncbi:MAG: lipase family protein [Hyphomicrobium sp.]|uniref:lipase family protein n=1 Tax=Hyphomicrobium sp. TaxID=82 RepID=UPI00132A0C29|nr:lipase family protein [Hyphomicrobium sp.]KAB2939690.1 MAG: alpha/beta fold hydrolase [Hyphomicrobium sp.]MBZ0208033.1 lipase family protein [Hyphomicrobium sp.]
MRVSSATTPLVRLIVVSILAGLAVAQAAPAVLAAPDIKLDVSQAEIRRAKPGRVFHVHPQIGGAPANAKAFRIVYRSTNLKGEPIAVSGTVIYPAAPGPSEGRDVIAWAHYTTGVAGRCAPTLLPNLSGTIPGLEDMLARGYVVVATDYEGLGLPGVHAYLVGVSEARSVLDSVRAARNLAGAHATNRFAVWGHSQGGHASLFSGELAAEYAPELKLVGVAAAAPATNLVDLFKAQKGSIAGNSLTAMALLSWSRTYNLPLDEVLEEGVDKRFEKVAESCIQSISQMLKMLQLARPLRKAFLKADPTTIPAWRELMQQNSPGHAHIKVPVFIAQGTGDVTVNSGLTVRFAKELCAAGTPVTLMMLKNVSHGFAAEKSAYAAVNWMRDRFKGRPAPNDCGR